MLNHHASLESGSSVLLEEQEIAARARINGARKNMTSPSTCVGHGQKERAIVDELKVLVVKLGAVD